MMDRKETNNAFGDGEAYKKQVEEAKKKLRRQIAVLMLFSFFISLGIFLIFYYIVKVWSALFPNNL